MPRKTYHDEIEEKNTKKLWELEKKLPLFCKQFFRGIENTTSSRTKLAYAYDLQIFFQYIKDNNPKFRDIEMQQIPIEILDELNVNDIEEYLDQLKIYEKDDKKRVNHEQGIMRKLSSLRSFYNYFYRSQKITSNPPSMILTPKLHEKEIIRLDPNEVSTLLDTVENGDRLSKGEQRFHSKTKIRDLAILTLLLGTGIRVSECVGIDIQDIDFDNVGIKIRRKGGNEAIVYFGDEVEQALKEYLTEREKITPLEGNENALFLSIQKKRMTVRSVEKLVKKYASKVTTLKKITPHKLRSTYGTSLYQETNDIYLVADVLGHKDINTTRKHYAAQMDENRRNARNKVILREDIPSSIPNPKEHK